MTDLADPLHVPVRKVLLVLRTDHSFARQIVRGVVGFGRSEASERWLFYHRLPSEVDFDPGEYDGILASVSDEMPATARLLASDTPTLAVANWPRDKPWSIVTADDRAIGRTAAEHFLASHYQRLAFVGERAPFADLRLEGFREALAEAGRPPAVFEKQLPPDWLIGIDKPAAVFADNDVQGQRVLNQCRALNIEVPQDIAAAPPNTWPSRIRWCGRRCA